MKVAVDVQHRYKTGSQAADRGTRYVLSGGGVVWESDLASVYASHLAGALEVAGATVVRNDPARGTLVGPYWRRHAQALALGCDVYLACHVNAGGGSYALAEYVGGTDSYLLASDMVTALDHDNIEILSGHARILVPGQRGYGCLPASGYGVLLEPFFGDKRSHQVLADPARLAAIGRTLAAALLKWWVAP